MKLKKLLPLAVLSLAIVSCGKDDSPEPKPTENSNPKIEGKTFNVLENITDSDPIATITATDTDGDALTFSITSDPSGLFAITTSGALSLSQGKALDFDTAQQHVIQVTVADTNEGTASANFTINVQEVGLSLDMESLELFREQSIQVQTTLLGITGTVSWSSSDEAIATVDQDGNVTAVDRGSAVITATIEELSATLDLTVNPSVYIAGRLKDQNSTYHLPTLWINGTPITLSNSPGAALSVFVKKGIGIHTSGYDNSMGQNAAMLWVNSDPVQNYTDGQYNALATSVFLDENNTIHLAGYANNGFKNVAMAWPTELTDGSQNAYANANFVENGLEYVAGTAINENSYGVATVWKNGQLLHELSNGLQPAEANAIFVNNNDIYVAGRDATYPNKILVWKNGDVFEHTTNGAMLANAYSICLNNNDETVVGGYEFNTDGKSVAKVWVNGEATSLTDGTLNGQTRSVTVDGNDVYAVTYESDGNSSYQSKIWKNGTLFQELEGNARVYSIFVY